MHGTTLPSFLFPPLQTPANGIQSLSEYLTRYRRLWEHPRTSWRLYVFGQNRHGFDETLKQSDCLLSLVELAEHVGAPSSTELLTSVEQFLALAEKPPSALQNLTEDEIFRMAQAIRGTRELLDLLRRIRFAQLNSNNETSVAECLALHRWEGAFTLPPSMNSMRHAPFVITKKGTCRTPETTAGDMTISREGFMLRVPVDDFDTIGRTSFDLSAHLLRANLVTQAGLDRIANNHLDSHFFDESVRCIISAFYYGDLREQLTTALQPLFPSITTVGPEAPSQNQMRWFILQFLPNLLIHDIDQMESPRSLSYHLERIVNRAARLLNWHEATPVPLPVRSGPIYLLGDDRAHAARETLALQSEWFSSRRSLHTILSHTDRPAYTNVTPLTPFMTYLRFNAGDEIFMGILLRTLVQAWPKLLKYWKSKGQSTSVPAKARQEVRNALDATPSPTLTQEEVATLKQALDHWRTSVHSSCPPKDARNPNHRGKTYWGSIGLIDMLQTQDHMAWLGRAFATADEFVAFWRATSWKARSTGRIYLSADQRDWDLCPRQPPRWTPQEGENHRNTLLTTAEYARNTVDLLQAKHLIPLLCLFLELTPMEQLRGMKAIPTPNKDWRDEAPLRRSHAFESLRIIYESGLTHTSI